MSDTFSNGPGAPPPQAGDVTGALAELERKLRELESELSSIGRRRELGGAAAPSASEPGAGGAEPGAGGARLVDEALEPPSQFTSTAALPASAPPTPAPATPPTPSATQSPTSWPSTTPTPSPRMTPMPAPPPPPLPPRAPAPQARPAPERPGEAGPAEAKAPLSPTTPPEPAQGTGAPEERQSPSDAQLASLAELRRFRDRLERFARDLADEYDALLGRVMSGLTSPTTSAHPSPVPPTAAPGPEDVRFEGHVELGVGPFYDMAALTAFERRLAGLAFVAEVSVRRFEASHAVVDVRLAAPVALVRELRRAIDSDFNVREIADGRVLLTFDEA